MLVKVEVTCNSCDAVCRITSQPALQRVAAGNDDGSLPMQAQVKSRHNTYEFITLSCALSADLQQRRALRFQSVQNKSEQSKDNKGTARGKQSSQKHDVQYGTCVQLRQTLEHDTWQPAEASSAYPYGKSASQIRMRQSLRAVSQYERSWHFHWNVSALQSQQHTPRSATMTLWR